MDDGDRARSRRRSVASPGRSAPAGATKGRWCWRTTLSYSKAQSRSPDSSRATSSMLAPRTTRPEPDTASSSSGTSIRSTAGAAAHRDRRREAADGDVGEEVVVVVLPLGELQDHEGAVAGGVEARVGQAELHARRGERADPVARAEQRRVAAVRRVGQDHAVGGKDGVPVGGRGDVALAVGTVGEASVAAATVGAAPAGAACGRADSAAAFALHHHGDQGGVGRGEHVEAAAQVGHLADDLDAAVALGRDAHTGVRALVGLGELGEGDDEAAGVDQREAVGRRVRAGAGRGHAVRSGDQKRSGGGRDDPSRQQPERARRLKRTARRRPPACASAPRAATRRPPSSPSLEAQQHLRDAADRFVVGQAGTDEAQRKVDRRELTAVDLAGQDPVLVLEQVARAQEGGDAVRADQLDPVALLRQGAVEGALAVRAPVVDRADDEPQRHALPARAGLSTQPLP